MVTRYSAPNCIHDAAKERFANVHVEFILGFPQNAKRVDSQLLYI